MRPASIHPPRLRAFARALVLIVLGAFAVGCDSPVTSDDAGSDAASPTDAGVVIPEGWPKANCDALDPTACTLPWPSGLYLEPTDETETGVRLTFGSDSLPENVARRPLEPATFAGLDGYGFGTPIMVGLGALDYSALAGEWEGMGRSLDADSSTLLFEVQDDGLSRVAHFVEPDLRADDDAPMTYLRPAVLFEPATRYVVAFRNLTTEDDAPVVASDAFAALRDGTPTDDPGVESRREHFETIFSWLDDAGVQRSDLVLAWDFVTGSEAALHRRLDQSIEAALTSAPDGGTITIDEVERFAAADDGSGDPIDASIRYRLTGRMTRPTVVVRDESGTGWVMSLDANGDVALAGQADTPVLIQVPHRALSGEPEGVIVYGHGLFGNENEIRAGHLRQLAETHGYVLAAVPMVGMSAAEVDGVVLAITDLNNFGVVSDGLHQGLLDHHLLVRAARRTLGSVLTAVDADIAIDPTEVHYFGGSQGGIFGQTVLASSPDLTRGVMAVPGNNYRTLLPRSVDFEDFEMVLEAVYPTAVERAIVLAALQLLWDRTDPVSYLGRMLEPARFSEPERRALFLLAKGDYQVAVLTNEIAARTWPDSLRMMASYDTERTPYGLVPTDYPYEGSGMVLFDFGNPWPEERGNLPPDDGLSDPHGRIAEIEEAGVLLETFLSEGRIIDICGGDGCTPR